MQAVVSYQVISPFLGVRLVMLCERFVTVPADAIVEISDENQERPGLITVSVNGETMLAIERDIVERSDLSKIDKSILGHAAVQHHNTAPCYPVSIGQD